MKLLYEYPCQILPVLSLVSTERETGKTTFLNYIQMLFGENSTLINPSDLMSSFNDAYATKNIIMIDETVIEKQHVVEKLKSLATAKTISVSQKFVQHYSVPFFGKIIVCTNKETDFMRIDDEEIRFWIRKINPIVGKKNTNIENDLFNEIPKFLKYLEQLPDIDFSNSRMVFTQEEIQTDSLELIKKESKNGLRKELEIYIEDFFNNNDVNEFEATAKDIKERWFDKEREKMSYILKVLKNEMKMTPQPNKYYFPFNSNNYLEKKKGTPFLFVRENNQSVEYESYSDYENRQPF
jgi:phage/plasmid-associated DNA primase